MTEENQILAEDENNLIIEEEEQDLYSITAL